MEKFLIIIVLVGLVISFFLSGNKKSSLLIEGDHLFLKTKAQNSYPIAILVHKQASQSFGFIEVSQYEFKSMSDETLFYEEVEIDGERVFNYGLRQNLSYIFNAKEVYVNYHYGDIIMAQIKLEDRSVINVLAEFSDGMRVSLLYGFSNKEFTKLVRLIDKKAKIGTEELQYEVQFLTSDTPLKSDWSDTKLLQEPLTMIITE